MRIIVALVFFSVFGLIISATTYPLWTQDTFQTVIREKTRECSGSQQSVDCRYMVYTQGEVFSNTDSMMNFKFNSSDVQNDLEVGNEYILRVYGWRVPFLSMYRNILSAKEVN
jgi:hypothetical protein